MKQSLLGCSFRSSPHPPRLILPWRALAYCVLEGPREMVSWKPVAGLTPGLFPLLWQRSRSLSHLPLMNHPNGNSDYVRLQFGPTWSQEHSPARTLTSSLSHLPFPSTGHVRSSGFLPFHTLRAQGDIRELNSALHCQLHSLLYLDAADLI